MKIGFNRGKLEYGGGTGEVVTALDMSRP
jgi:hypothetical protein